MQDEVELLLRGQGEAWDRQLVLSALHCDHGYCKASAPVNFLVATLCELAPAEQRALLSFITGSPRLPPGGLAALRPRLTVVRKHSGASWSARVGPPATSHVHSCMAASPKAWQSIDCRARRLRLGLRAEGAQPAETSSGHAGGDGDEGMEGAADRELPSVMTCANYIKLPPYSSQEACRRQLMLAITEGQGSFDLS